MSNTVLNSQLMSAPPGGGGGVSDPTDTLAQILRQSAKNRIFIVKPLPQEVPPSEAVEPLAAEATTTSAPSKQQPTTGGVPLGGSSKSKPTAKKAVESEPAEEEEGWLW